MSDIVLETQKLTKTFGHVKAVQGLDLEVTRGQVFGMLGPNGSGKTTTLGMLLGVTNPTSGKYLWFGKKGDHTSRKRIGAILEMPVFYPYMNAQQNLEIACIIKEIPYTRIDPALELVGLLDRKFDRFKTYSLGMKQRLAIASAFLSDPEVMILDEPTNGLDPMGIADIRLLIRRIAEMGKTIILASHLLDEVQRVCSHFCVLKTGTLIYSGSVSEDFSDQSVITLSASNIEALAKILVEAYPNTSVERDGDVIVMTSSAQINAAEINRTLFEKDIILNHLAVKKRSLEEQFLKILQEHA